MLSGRMEWALDGDSKAFDGKSESEFLAQSIADVAKHYGGELFDQKTVDWLNLMQCLAMVYGGRIIAIRMTPKGPKPKPPPTVQDIARSHAPTPPGQHHTPPPVNEFRPAQPGSDDINTGEIAGIGAVEFPEGHPLHQPKPKLN